MVVVTSTTTKVHLNGDHDGHAQLASRPSSLFSGGGGRNGSIGVSSGSESPSSVLDSASRVGLDCIVENPDYVHKLASALESKSLAVKKQVFELLSALSVYSPEGYARTLQALDAFRAAIGERYRFKFLVAELQHETSSLEYKTSILAFINCLILASPDSQERIRTRCEFIGLRLMHVLNELRSRHKDNAGLVIQLDVFEEQKESDEAQQLTSARGIDLTSPLEVFDAILRQISGTPQEVPFLCMLQHLLSIDPKEPMSDLIWDAAERLVHRATLLETRDDALRMLKTPSHAKSLQKLQKDGKCSCNCHGSKLSLPPSTGPAPTAATNTTGSAPAPPPPPPAPPAAPGPPPPPSPPSPPRDEQTSKTTATTTKNLPKLPQQSLPPVPKAKMKTINWNKIPNGQILNGQNLWTTFSKKQAANTLLDWQELEGLFCLQNEGSGGMVAPKAGPMVTGTTPPGVIGLGGIDIPTSGKINVREIAAARNGGCLGATTISGSSSNDSNSQMQAKRETSELILLDAKRSLNINIFLKQFRSSNQQIVQLILQGSSQEFGAEKLRGLLKLLPSSDEVEMLNLVSKADQSRLASAERFLLALIQVDNYRLRVEAMLLREELEVSLANIDASIGAVLTAAADLKASEQFQQVIFMILVAGNFLNSGGYAGDAAGVKLSSLQKIGDIRGNKPGISLLHFIVMQAEARDTKLVGFVNEMPALEEASKTSIEQLKAEITSLNSKVQNLTSQIRGGPEGTTPHSGRKVPRDILQQYGSFLDEARDKIAAIESYFAHVERTRVDLAQFFCEELASFKIEDCFRIILGFINKWRDAAADNAKRRKQEQEAEARRRAREEQFKKRVQQQPTGQQQQQQLNPDDDLFIACSPRIVRRRLGSLASHDNMSSGSTQGSNDQLTLPSPDITPNGSIRKRRSRLSSDEDESNLMDFLRSSSSGAAGGGGGGGSGSAAGTPTSTHGMHIGSPSTPRKLPGSIIDNQYGSLDRSWSRGTRRRPNLMDFVNSDRERPISPATHVTAIVAGKTEGNVTGGGGSAGQGVGAGNDGQGNGEQHKHESPAREWRERITAWFVDLENGGGSGEQKRRPPPRRFQSRFVGDSVLGDTNRGLATLPEVEPNPDETGGGVGVATNYTDTYRTPFTTRTNPAPTTPGHATVPTPTTPTSTYERVYPDRRPSLKVNTDVVSAMEAIEGAQTPVKEKTLWRSSSINSEKNGGAESPTAGSHKLGATTNNSHAGHAGRRSLIGSLGASGKRESDEKLTLYIPEGRRPVSTTTTQHTTTTNKSPQQSPEIHESEFGTKEGFDRFASIRRSRRIKKADELPSSRPTSFGRAPPGPDTPIPSRRFISKVDITDEPTTNSASSPAFARTTKSGTLQRTTANAVATNKMHARNPRSISAIDSKHVDTALNLHKFSNTSRNNGSTTTTMLTTANSNAIPIPNSSNGNGNMHASSSLSTSPAGTTTSAENDEGFEESPNSLTETSTDLVLQNNLNNRLRRSFRESQHQHVEEGGNIKGHSVSSGATTTNQPKGSLFSIPLIRRKSRQENVPVIMDSAAIPTTPSAAAAATASRRPLISNANGHGYRGIPGTSPTPHVASAPKSSQVSNGHTTPYRNGGTEISHHEPLPSREKSTSASKTRTPRLLSFMRPTASSSAKDKLEAKMAAAAAGGVKSSTNTNTTNAALYSNKRAFK